ncbi:MAG TPA: AraC family transcriptional regulator [Candidatus Limnocylindria bacterium]|nr:AraC family transcriptional regulator [Candidatus Limnocylindria bacterium]
MRPVPQLLLQKLELAAGSEWTPVAGYWLFGFIADGLGYLFQGAATLEVSAGMMLVEPPSAKVIFRSSQLTSLQVQWFLLDINRLFGVLTLPERSWLRSGYEPVAGIRPTWGKGDALPQAFVQAALGVTTATNAVAQRARLLGVVGAYLARVMPPVPERRHPFLNSSDRLLQLLHTMTESEFLALSVDELAEHCHCDRRRVLQLFREASGSSMRDYQNDLRKLRVNQLLEQGASLPEIARECGYDTPESFRAWFRRAFGTGLNRWIETHQADEERPENRSESSGS